MNRRDLNIIKKRLNQWRKDLFRDADCNLDGLNETDEPLPDIVDRATTVIDRTLSHRMCDRASLLVKKIQQSLQDIEDGFYGICERCGEDVAIKRLKANPVARHCISCKTEIETRERLTGI
ncbi:MAG: TraR/DksA C4-type zinc finger protein [Desulfobacterales bacterium]|nr:MAG: TraR/DksA C4-type zinc finger protein [Desulfobacterales bacterium]